MSAREQRPGVTRPFAVALALAAALLLAPLSGEARAEHSGCPEWSDPAATYPYPFNGIGFNLPECRLGGEGSEDYGTHALEPQKLSLNRSLGTLERNPAARRKVRWPLLDSFGRQLAVLTRHKDRWETTNPSTGALIYRDYTLSSDQFTVQGRGCMADDTLEAGHVLLAFHARDRSTIPAGASIVPYQIRAFIGRGALPPDVRSQVDGYDTGCGGSSLSTQAPALVPDAAYDSNDHRFYGEDGIARTYATYNVKSPYRNARYFLTNTTGVGGGGIVRGVVQQDTDLVGELGDFGYCDPNAVGGTRVATWLNGRIGSSRMWGWLPARCP